MGLFFTACNNTYQKDVEQVRKMNTIIMNLCQYGTLLFDRSEKGIEVIFEPHYTNDLSESLQSTVMIVRTTPEEAVAALNQYVEEKKHWSEYSREFITGGL
jgi:hypothetical protein